MLSVLHPSRIARPGDAARIRLAPRMLVLLAVPALLGPPRAAAESWTDLSGTRTIEADMVGLFGDQLVLRLPDGRRVSVAIDKLRAESRIQAKELSGQQAEGREQRIEELQRQADAAAAAAPDPLPTPEPAPEYAPPREGMSAAETLRYLDEQERAGHLLAFYDALPVSYRDQLEGLVAQASLKVDPSAWRAVTGTLHQVGDLVVTHQNWIFSHPKLRAMPADQRDQLRDLVLPLAGFLRVGFAPERMQLEEIQTKLLRDWLVAWDDATAPYLAKLAGQPAGELPQYEEQPSKGDVVTVQRTVGETTESIEMKQVDGMWIWASLADDWPKWFEQAQKQLDEMPDASLGREGTAQMITAAVGPTLQPFRTATDGGEFHAAMDSLFAQAAAGAEAMRAMLPAEIRGLAGTGPNRRGGSDDIYGDYYGDDYSGDGGDGDVEGDIYGDDYQGN